MTSFFLSTGNLAPEAYASESAAMDVQPPVVFEAIIDISESYKQVDDVNMKMWQSWIIGTV